MSISQLPQRPPLDGPYVVSLPQFAVVASRKRLAEKRRKRPGFLARLMRMIRGRK